MISSVLALLDESRAVEVAIRRGVSVEYAIAVLSGHPPRARRRHGEERSRMTVTDATLPSRACCFGSRTRGAAHRSDASERKRSRPTAPVSRTGRRITHAVSTSKRLVHSPPVSPHEAGMPTSEGRRASRRGAALRHDDRIGGWGSRRKPMALVRALAASDLRDLTVVSYGGRRRAAVRRPQGPAARYGFVALDSIPLEPHFRERARPARWRSPSTTRGCSAGRCTPPRSGSRSCRPARGSARA